MNMNVLARKSIALLTIMSLVLTGCVSPQQLRERYTTFDQCFRETRVSTAAAMALIGAIGGAAAAKATEDKNKQNNKQRTARYAATGLAVGAAVGYASSWQTCMNVFPAKAETSVVTSRAELASTASRPLAKSLEIETVDANPLAFGKGLPIRTTYRYTSDDPARRDVKARVHRVLKFKNPESGVLETVPSNTEDTIQQGISRSNFEIPLPSLQDAPDLSAVKEWFFTFIVEVDGMRAEKTVALSDSGPPLPALSSSPNQAPAQPAVEAVAGSKGDVSEKAIGKFNIVANTLAYEAASTESIFQRIKSAQEVSVFERKTIGKFQWLRIRTADGIAGWIRRGVGK